MIVAFVLSLARNRAALHVATLGATLAAHGCGACGPSSPDESQPALPTEEGAQYARAVCQAAVSCGCGDAFEDMSACEAQHHERFDQVVAAGLAVVPECFDEWRADLDDDPCQGDQDEPGGPPPCAQLRGRKTKGSTCEAHPGVATMVVDECAAGLSCRNERCVETPSTNQGTFIELGTGEPCGPTYDGVCRLPRQCGHVLRRRAWRMSRDPLAGIRLRLQSSLRVLYVRLTAARLL